MNVTFDEIEINMPGSDQVKESFKYVYGKTTSGGKVRIAVPKFVCGVERPLLETLGRDLGPRYKQPVTKGSINCEEKLPPKVVVAITNSFFDFAYAGIDWADWLNHATEHQKELKVSGQLSSDIHFMVLHWLVCQGRIFRPYFKEADWYGFHLWTEKTNYEHHLSSPFDPKRWRISQPRIYGSDTPELVEFKQEIGGLVAAAFDKHILNDASAVIKFLSECPAIKKAWYDKGRILADTDLHKRPVALKALIYSSNYEEGLLRKKIDGATRVTEEDCVLEFKRILAARETRHWKEFGQPTLRWTFQHLILPEAIITINPSKPYDFRTTTARSWVCAINLDRQFGGSFERLGIACRQLGSDLVRAKAIVGLESQGKDGLLGEGFGITGDVQERVHLFSSAAEALGSELGRADRVVKESRGSSPSPGELDGIHIRFDEAFRRVGGGFAGSVAEILDFFRVLYEKKKSKEDKKLDEKRSAPPSPTAFTWLQFLAIRTELEMVVLAARKGILSDLPIAVFQNLKVASLDVPLGNGRTLADAIAAQLESTVLFQVPQLLIPPIAWHVAGGLTRGPAGVPTKARAALLSTEALAFRPSSKDQTLAQILATRVEGSDWVAAMGDHGIQTLYTEATLEKLNSAVPELIPQEGHGGKDRIAVEGAVLIRGAHGIEALGGLKEVIKRGLTPAAAELRRTIEMANSPEVFQPRLVQTKDDTRYPSRTDR